MRQEPLKTCTYCLKKGRSKNLTPLYEVGKEHVSYYCPLCLPVVKKELQDYGKHLKYGLEREGKQLGPGGIPPWLYFGRKGEHIDKDKHAGN